MACVNALANCSHLPFKDYQPITKHKNGVVEVKCPYFKRKE